MNLCQQCSTYTHLPIPERQPSNTGTQPGIPEREPGIPDTQQKIPETQPPFLFNIMGSQPNQQCCRDSRQLLRHYSAAFLYTQ